MCAQKYKPATLAEIAKHGPVLTPGRYVGAEEQEDDAEPFVEKYPRLVAELEEQLAEEERLAAVVNVAENRIDCKRFICFGINRAGAGGLEREAVRTCDFILKGSFRKIIERLIHYSTAARALARFDQKDNRVL